jgi:hypothetical protein
MLGSHQATGVPRSFETNEGHINRGRNYVLEAGGRTGSVEKQWGMTDVSCLFIE